MTTKELSTLLDQFKKDTLKKFKKGRREHGQKWTEIDYDSEIEGELMDLLVYHWLQRRYQPRIPKHIFSSSKIPTFSKSDTLIGNVNIIPFNRTPPKGQINPTRTA